MGWVAQPLGAPRNPPLTLSSPRQGGEEAERVICCRPGSRVRADIKMPIADAAVAPGPKAPPPGGAILELRKLDKRFTGTHALKAVNLAFMPGEIHAIVGENGAGKSTLIKLLTGVHMRSAGDILWQGEPVR